MVEVTNSDMAVANRKLHFNVAIVPIWWDEKNDDKCGQWSKKAALSFKEELEREGVEAGESNDGWIGKRGTHEATTMYENYDRE